jgi:hypothetical protein
MKQLLGVIAVAGALGLIWFIGWRITDGVEGWFVASGAGNLLMWSLVAALILTVGAIPAAAWGIAARMWVVKMHQGQYLASTAHALLPQAAPQLTEVKELEYHG